MFEIGYAMRTARMEKGWDRDQLATKSGVPKRTIQSYETGTVAPGLLNLIDLADALGISMDDYVGHKIGGQR